MNDLPNHLFNEGLISQQSKDKLEEESKKPLLFPLHWEVQTLLYIGVLLLTTGLGLLIYDHLDTLGHQFVLILIAAICAGCFFYCFKHQKAFSWHKVDSPNPYFDYILLLGALSLVSFIGYLQFAYNVFGTNYGLASFIPMAMLFYLAYRFDHLGILGLAIANFAVWMGVSLSPRSLLMFSFAESQPVIYTYVFFGSILLAAGLLTGKLQFKPHFKFSYQHYGIHVTYAALLTGLFNNFEEPQFWLWALVIVGLSFYIYRDAFQQRSFYFAVLMALYSYVALSTVVIKSLVWAAGLETIAVLFMYFIGSGTGFILLLIKLNRKFKTHDSLQQNLAV